MPKTNTTPVPRHNILDLRQNRPALPRREEKTGPKKKPRQPFDASRFQPWHDRPAVNWLLVRRESLKYLGILLALAVPLGAVFGIRSVLAKATDMTAEAKQGLVSVREGFAALGKNDPAAAQTAFAAAEKTFHAVQRTERSLVGWVTPAVKKFPGVARKFSTADAVIAAGLHVSQAGRTLSAAVNREPQPAPTIIAKTNGVVHGSFGSLTPLFADGRVLQQAMTDLAAGIKDLSGVQPTDVPPAMRDAWTLWKGFADTQYDIAERLRQMGTLLAQLFAAETPREYLFVLQNNDELRPTGGFMGTIMLVKMDHGAFTVIDAPPRGPYDVTDNMPKTNLPPDPLRHFNSFWAFQDSNWFVDAPSSARVILDFYRQARGFTPDGIIFVTPTVIEDLLTLTGPLALPEYDLTIDADSFLRTTETQVEKNYNKAANNPKQFIVDLLPALLGAVTKLPPAEAWQAMATVLARIDQHDLLLYSREETTQATIDSLGWDGRFLMPTHDAVAVVDTNIGGGKTDRVIAESVVMNVSVDGSRLIHRVDITRTHRGPPGEEFGGTDNSNFVRVYAPPDASLLKISGATVPEEDWYKAPAPGGKIVKLLTDVEGQVLIDPITNARVSHDNGWTVFGAWSYLKPGESQTMSFTYATPFTAVKGGTPWAFSWLKQPGAPTRQWKVIFTASDKAKIVVAPTGIPMKADKKSVTWTTDSTVPRTFSAIIR